MNTTLDKPQSRKALKAQHRNNAIVRLRALLKPGDTIHTILRHVSKSGMMRHIDLCVICDNIPRCISHSAAVAMGYTQSESGAIKVSGCGMDMGFHLVYNLGRTLFPKGFGMPTAPNGGDIPRIREEAAARVAYGLYMVPGRNGDTSGWDNDGGYALNHRWL